MHFYARLNFLRNLFFSIFLLSAGLQSHLIQAAMISTESQVAATELEYDREKLEMALSQEEARATLIDLGVDPKLVAERVQLMSAEELAQFNTELEDMPVGSGVVGTVVLVFVILIVLDLLGTTNIFPAITPINQD